LLASRPVAQNEAAIENITLEFQKAIEYEKGNGKSNNDTIEQLDKMQGLLSEFVRLQAENIERWTEQLAAGEITPAGYKKLVSKMDVLTKLEEIKLEVAAKASAQRLADGIQKHIIDGLGKLL
jgi:hypothetical protein